MNYKMIRYILGSLLMVMGALFLLPILTALIYRESCVFRFLAAAAICLLIGFLMRRNKTKNTRIYATEGYVAVALSWIVMSIFGAMPLYFSGFYPNPIDALFETVSGFTTTGATILSDVECLPKAVLIWRSFTHWIGGMGVLVFILAILPVAGGSSMHLMRAESPGPAVGKLVPKIRSTAKILYGLYIAMTILMMILLIIAGAPVFDSINLALSTAGTGGFGFLNDSAASYNSTIKIIITVFMTLFGINFNVYFFLYAGSVKAALKCEEMRVYLGIIVVFSLIIGFDIMGMYAAPGEAFIDSFFQVSSIITTTGFSTTDFDLWPSLSKSLLVLLMFIGACAGSTGGGMKVSRIIIMFKSIGKEISSITHPRIVKKIHLEYKPVEHEVLRSVNVFVMAYLFLFVGSLLIISAEGKDLVTNFTAVATTINNVGPGLSKVGPICNFGHYSNLSKLVFIFNMLAGRLELFPMLVLCTPGVWRKSRR
ncbi:MAG: TrkH family potassium uptake protein [Lachnospiraceae bacterium]|nr:TrkH family potassium uptake protein [Lachnospiraceae bacterium]